MKYAIPILFIFVMLSCTSRKAEKQENPELPITAEVTNEDLRTAILEYDSLLRIEDPIRDYLLYACEQIINDSVTVFRLSHDCGTYEIQCSTVSLAKIEERYIVFYRDNEREGFTITDKEIARKIVRRYYPDHYAAMKRNHNSILGVCQDGLGMTLTFEKNKLVKKKLTGMSRKRHQGI